MKKEKRATIEEIRDARRRLDYKKSEYLALVKLLEIEKEKERTKNIGYLRRQKEKLEFMIATEAALTPEKEKEIIRRINAINEDLDKALRSYRLRKKSEAINATVEELQKKVDEMEKKVNDANKKLDDLYSRLRELTGYKKHVEKVKHERKEQKHADISFADIAIIKNRSEDEGSEEKEGPSADESN